MATTQPRGPQEAAGRENWAHIDLDHPPERPTITMENVYQPETDYERWLTKMVWTDARRGVPAMLEWVNSLPVFTGAPDNSDVLPPGAPPVNPPEHWLKVPIHFTPLADPKWARVYHVGNNYFTFTRKDVVRNLFARIYAGQRPKRILDLGCGTGPSSMALAELFPDAEVIGVDLGAHFVRFARGWAKHLGITNVQFYQQHAGELSFEDNSFDVVNESYVLHEMPTPESQKIVMEMHRVLKPGGRFSCIDVIYDEDPEKRQARVERTRGPEPFLSEYMKL
ncbi:MAG: class I SAM-dependent methyltransferase, partial [Dehalococcoidia bacterium]|nr:class I SAM-dependent methyltransferase [Dehalococcoidia bacterium]